MWSTPEDFQGAGERPRIDPNDGEGECASKLVQRREDPVRKTCEQEGDKKLGQPKIGPPILQVSARTDKGYPAPRAEVAKRESARGQRTRVFYQVKRLVVATALQKMLELGI